MSQAINDQNPFKQQGLPAADMRIAGVTRGIPPEPRAGKGEPIW